jgi:preprotein translocase subunit SecG
MLFNFLLIIHIIISVAMIFIVLIQTGKGGLDSNFGGIASNTLGAQGATEIVKKWTKILFIVFVLSCILMANYVGREGPGRESRASRRAREEAERLGITIPTEAVPLQELTIPEDELIRQFPITE